jgi:membrane-associated phospholipid phosphatase
MKEDAEINIIKNLQKLPGKYKNIVTKFMSCISAPFHCKLYVLIIFLLYLIGKITTPQVFILCSSQFIIFTIKYIVKRKRPFEASKQIKLLEPMSFDPYSFPSGHTLNAFLLSYILRKNTGFTLGIIPYLVSLSRVYLGVHYPSDILGGVILTKIILHLHKFY